MKTLFLGMVVLSITNALFGTKVESHEESLAEERRHAPTLERAILDAQEITLLSIAPNSRYDPQEKGRSYVIVDGLEGRWLITGEAKIADQKKMADLAGSLRSSIEEKREFEAPPCFSPRHAIRFRRGPEEVTVLVCFECWQCYTHRFKERGYFQVSASPEPIWTAIFTNAGLRISE